MVTLRATATDNLGVTQVEFSVGAALVCTDTTSPYTCNWTVPGASGVYYTLTAKAYDADNNTATHSVTVRSR